MKRGYTPPPCFIILAHHLRMMLPRILNGKEESNIKMNRLQTCCLLDLYLVIFYFPPVHRIIFLLFIFFLPVPRLSLLLFLYCVLLFKHHSFLSLSLSNLLRCRSFYTILLLHSTTVYILTN